MRIKWQRWIISFLLVILLMMVMTGLFVLIDAGRFKPLPPTIDLQQAITGTVAAFTAIPPDTATFTPSPTATPTPSATPSPTASLSPTPPLAYPAKSFGAPTWQDTFDDEHNWALVNDSCIKTKIQDGKYVITSKKAPSPTCWEVSWPQIQNFYLETTISIPEGCSGKDRFGLIFRAPDAQRGYLFGLTCDGEYWLAKWDGASGEGDFVIEFTESSAITISPEAANTIGVLANSSQIVLYANGNQLAEIFDETFPDPGLIGLFIGAYETQNFSVEYNELTYWELP
jgi:hypothetical protein